MAPRTHQSNTKRVQKTPVKRLQQMPTMSAMVAVALVVNALVVVSER